MATASGTKGASSYSGTWLEVSIGGPFAGLPRMARAALMGRGSTNVRFVTLVVNRENLEALATLLESGDVRVVIGNVYPLREAGNAVAHMLGTTPGESSPLPRSG